MNRPNAIVIYDGSCGFCTKSVLFILRRDKERKLYFSANGSEMGKRILAEYGLYEVSGDSLVFLEHGTSHIYSDAGLRICRYLKFPWNLLQVLLVLPKALRDPLYRFIARNRHKLVRQGNSCMIPTRDISERFLED